MSHRLVLTPIHAHEAVLTFLGYVATQNPDWQGPKAASYQPVQHPNTHEA